MSTTTTTAQDLATLVAYGRKTDAQRLAYAQAAHRMVARGVKQADLARQVTEKDPTQSLSAVKKSLSLALKAYRETLTAADGDATAVTAEGYGESFRAVNSASAESGRGNAGGTRKAAGTAGNDQTRPATLEDALAAIAALTEWAASQDDADREILAAALFDASESLSPTVLIATPVAA